ncbi:MAG: SLC13 family permease [Escherichia coli]|nr:SLC13 family permease [Escherichia coli]
MSLPFLRTLQGDRFFQLLILVGIGLSFFVPFAPKSWPAAIDWHTIITLSGLMLLTKGVELSGYFDVLGRKMVRRFATERRLAMFMVLAAALLSTFLTNDVALFIVVPLTITLKRLCEIPVNRLIIFEALAVNAGSLLTPIGNPQNILIWGRSGLSFAGFIAQMAPLAGAMMLTTALEFKQELWGLVIVAAGFALLARRVVLSVDWTLLLVFMAMFIDVHLLTQLPALQGVLGNVSHLSEPGLWLTAIGLSQVISNVPSTILLLNYVPPSLLLVWAVNVGGFGLLPGSLANLIALRMANDRRIWWRFHLYSIPMLLWAALVGYVLLVILPAN